MCLGNTFQSLLQEVLPYLVANCFPFLNPGCQFVAGGSHHSNTIFLCIVREWWQVGEGRDGKTIHL